MDGAMKLSIPKGSNEANVAVTLIKSGRPWLGYSLVIICRLLWCFTVAGLVVLGMRYGLR